MVVYCCVRGCNNNTNTRKKDPSSILSFHAFPSKQNQKTKWLKAIGRVGWDPPSHARVCSVHFDFNHISHDGTRTRILDDASPSVALPVNSNFEASELEVCRICLATDIKLFNIADGYLKNCTKSILGFNENLSIGGLPNSVCYECAALLVKCNMIFEKSMVSQATLLDIFAQNGQITMDLIRSKDRKMLNLTSSLSCNKPANDFAFIYDDYNNTALLIDSDCKENETERNEYKPDKDLNDVPQAETINFESYIFDSNNFELEEPINDEKSFDNLIKSDSDDDSHDLIIDETAQIEGETPSDVILDTSPIESIKEMIKEKSIKKRSYSKIKLSEEIEMQKYFTIVTLTLEQQIEDWNRTPIKHFLTGGTLYTCEICSKVFARPYSYNNHLAAHDPSRGNAECPVCKLRFKSTACATSHANRTHSKKFYCKQCSKVYSNVNIAKKHLRWHEGHTYRCARCPFQSPHQSAVHAHTRTRHASALACAVCGLPAASARGLALHRAAAHTHLQEKGSEVFKCEQCDINFASEGAKRVHLLTAYQHRKSSDLCDTTPHDPQLKNACSKCGDKFQSPKDLVMHIKAVHPRTARKKTSWRLPDDNYPKQCEECGAALGGRAEHWRHVRAHPALRRAYRAVVAAVCARCGKGFQNATKLRIHELRHSAPRVPCPQCTRRFHDKYAAARHLAVHSAARPHACRTCARSFKLRANLQRHYRVHTGVTPYECTICGKKFKYSTSMNLHVRTVHYKLPHPPRKKRSRINIDINC